ncbi:hypothetical protein P280DRAFT_248272 [Massarina eburnea CBS 473.64]|uniref:Uncharacterized protein n=1 Tax=Massarina eburnea CBS 473.64 TaxID=1395130 RepID=A0A6A6S697_9PLEO|nr:hypothetical protein P280DRAFT_248272 [Massarina eburnea CBS 473.64]
MLLTTLFPAITLYLILFIATLSAPTTAQPYSRFSHKIRSLHPQYVHPTFHLLPQRWRRAQPINKPATTRLHRRGLPGAVYICTQENFRGDCAWIMPDNECHIPGTGNNSPESVGPDPGGYCVLWQKATCSGNQIATLKFPGLDTKVPDFGGIKCFANANGNGTANATSIVQNGALAGSGILAASLKEADARLPGGVGSLDAMKLKEVMADMEKDGFKEGMIGLEKGHYY